MLLDLRFRVLFSAGGAVFAGVRNADFMLEVDTFACGFLIGSIIVFDLLPDLLDAEPSSPDLLADLLDADPISPDLLPELFKVLN